MTVSLDAVAEANRAERQRAVAICELCAEVPHLTEAFIGNGASPAQVKRELASRKPAADPQPRAGFDLALIERELAQKPTPQ